MVIKPGLVKATGLMTACGLYEAWLNGRPVTDSLYLPGYTNYHKRLQYQTYDITPLVKPGENVIGAVVGNGWYRGWNGSSNSEADRAPFGMKLKFMCRLRIEYEDGSVDYIDTDESWKATQDGPILKNDMRDGISYDARCELEGWNKPGFDDGAWHGVLCSSYPGELIPQEGEPILEQERFKAQVLQTPDGTRILDFGQNLAGYVCFKVTGHAGQEVLLWHGETLDENGNFTLKNLQNVGQDEEQKEDFVPFGQVVHYTLREGSQTFKPQFTVHGFRYVKLVGWPEEIHAENFEAIAVYTNMEMTGDYKCSNPLITQFVENTRWSLKSNFLDIPTDCPTRERAGWTGDAMVFAETASWLADTRRFFSKWIRDVAKSQLEDGLIKCIVPDNSKFGTFIDGSAGWGDVIEVIPWQLYQFYGDTAILQEIYPHIVRWVEANRKRARRKSIARAFKRGKHQRYILDTGYHWGEWLEPGALDPNHIFKNKFSPDAEVATGYYAYAALLCHEIASILHKEEDARKYKVLYRRVADAYRKEFLPQGEVVEKQRQCKYVRPIALHLVSKSQAQKLSDALDVLVKENHYHIGTGFLTTPYILSVLSEYGHADTAYRMMENTEAPGWLYAVEKGATTIWEDWYGIKKDGVPQFSHNHYSKGGTVSWLFGTSAGIAPLEPGFEKVRIKPIPGGDVLWVKCSYKSVRGLIRSEWEIKDGNFSLLVETPVQTVVCLPDGSEYEAEPGIHRYQCEWNGI